MPRNAATNRLAIRDYPASLNFTAATDRIDCGTDFVGTTAATISAWIYVRGSGGGSNGRIFDNGRCVFFYSLSNLAIGFNSDGASSIFSASGSVQINSGWVHVVVTRTVAGVANFYINSVASGAADQSSGTPGAATTNAFIGNRNAQDRNFNGRMNEVAVWNRVLTTAEISDLYFKGSVAASGLLRQFNLTTGAGTVAFDSSANLTNGTITGATFVGDSPMKARKASVNANMVKNGDFEYAPPFTAITTGGNIWLDGTTAGSTTNDLFRWYKINGAGTYAASFDSTTKFAGNYSIKMEETNATGRGRLLTAPFETNTTATLIVQYGIPVNPSTDYDISAYIKTNLANAASVRIIVLYYTSTGTQSGSSTGASQASTQDFTLVTSRFTTASTTAYVVIKLDDNTASGAAHQVWFDSVSLTPVYPEGRVPANGNLVKNFDFEVAPTFVAATNTTQRFIDGTAAGSSTNGTYKWAIVAVSTAGTFSAQFDSSVSFAGQYSMKLSIGATGSALNVGSLTLVSAANLANFGIPVIPNTSYTATYRMRTVLTSGSATTGARMNFNEYDSAAGNSVSNQGTAVLTTTDWTLYTVTFTTAATTNYIVPRLVLRGNDGAATLIMDAWFDDIYLAPTTNPGRVVIT